jgi:hypothetical protein
MLQPSQLLSLFLRPPIIHTIISAGHQSMSDLLSSSIDLGVLTQRAKLLARLFWRGQHDRADTTTGYLTFSHDRHPHVHADMLTSPSSVCCLSHMPARLSRCRVQPRCSHGQQYGRLRRHVRRRPLVQHSRLGDQRFFPVRHERRKLDQHVVPCKRYVNKPESELWPDGARADPQHRQSHGCARPQVRGEGRQLRTRAACGKCAWMDQRN